jgi:Raf kinase inhibitor-like YbhB/YbcL family protein
MKRLIGTVTVTIVVALFLCCKRAPVSNGPVTNVNKPDEAKMSIKITSTPFVDGGLIPKQYTCDGANVSPPLSWSGVPPNAKALVLICDDPDAPAKTWVHWVAYDLPVTLTSLPENTATTTELTGGGKQGANDFKKIGYGGPCPPSGTHRYYFKLYALDTDTSLTPGATKDQLLKAMEGHIVAQGQLMGSYKR